MEAQIRPGVPFRPAKRPGTAGFKAGVAVVSTGAATPSLSLAIGIRIARIGERLDKCSVPKVLKPGQTSMPFPYPGDPSASRPSLTRL